jgi:hypothetical protein
MYIGTSTRAVGNATLRPPSYETQFAETNGSPRDAVAPTCPARRRHAGSAERSRNWRRRKADGLRLLPSIELRETEIDLLIAKGLLREDGWDSGRAITVAIYSLLDDAFQALEIGALPVELLDSEVALLMERGLLKPEERSDKYAIAAAIYKVLEPAFAGLGDGSLKPAA